MSKALLVHEEDNVAVALEALQGGTTVEVASHSLGGSRPRHR